MRLKLAGGCGEHGRNCFYVELDRYSFLVDCGLMADSNENPYPHLSKDEINKVKYVFLTHSHADHTGALPWLIKQGFNGKVIATKETLKQLPFSIEQSISLTKIHYPIDGLSIKYGKSGHCIGSVWYKFIYQEQSIFFSGDYTEDTLCYKCDKIENLYANIAVIDAAYGNDDKSYQDYCADIIQQINDLKTSYTTILFPVPKYGRGIELYVLIKKAFPKFKFAGDQHFIKQLENSNRQWLKSLVKLKQVHLYNKEDIYDIVFVSNPQLKTKETREIAETVLKDGFAIMTGTIEKDTYSYCLLKKHKMIMCRYPVHLNYHQYKKMLELNHFDKPIAYHCPEIIPEKDIIEI